MDQRLVRIHFALVKFMLNIIIPFTMLKETCQEDCYNVLDSVDSCCLFKITTWQPVHKKNNSICWSVLWHPGAIS